MFLYQYVIILFYVLLMYNKSRVEGAITLLLAYCLYSLFIVHLQATTYYAAAAGLNLLVGVLICKKHFYPSLCSFSLIPINLYGFWLWYNYMSPDNYDNISLVVLLLQLILMLPRGLLNGLCSRRSNSKHSLVRLDDFDSSKACDIMYKSKTKKESNK